MFTLSFHLAERNLNPKAACLKRREEEKTEELPGRSLGPPVDLAQQAAMAGKVRINTTMTFTILIYNFYKFVVNTVYIILLIFIYLYDIRSVVIHSKDYELFNTLKCKVYSC